MFTKPCPYCQQPIGNLSKGMLKGKFNCPHCDGKLLSRPSMLVTSLGGGVGGALGVVLHMPFVYAIPLGILVSGLFVLTPTKDAS